MNATAALRSDIRFSLYVVFHPFDGFYDLKFEKRGKLAISFGVVVLVVLVFIMKRQLTGFLLNTYEKEKLNILGETAAVLVPFFLFCVTNWCITTLMDGDGSFRDILIYTGYSLIPLVLIEPFLIVMSNVLVVNELDFYHVISTLTYLWFGMLIFFGTAVTHQYTIKKTVASFVMILIGMGLFIFIGMLLFTLLEQITSFVRTVYLEITLRL